MGKYLCRKVYLRYLVEIIVARFGNFIVLIFVGVMLLLSYNFAHFDPLFSYINSKRAETLKLNVSLTESDFQNPLKITSTHSNGYF